MKRFAPRWLAFVLALAPLLAPAPSLAQSAPAAQTPAAATAAAPSFQVSIDPAALAEPYTGRVYIVLATSDRREPRLTMGQWFGGPTVVSLDVEGLESGESVTIDASAPGHPTGLGGVEPGEYSAQAVARRSTDSPNPGRGAGDLYSEPVRIRIGGDGTADPVELRLTRTVGQPEPFAETDRVKYFETVSDRLSEFHGREVKLRAGVVLPEGWTDDASKTWPVVYFITGFGGSDRDALSMARRVGTGLPDAQCLVVVPDPTWYRGHTAFADSANNGPWGAALIEELIPAVEKEFHGANSGERRYVTGVSSGGWSSLWLQMTYPEAFRSAWAHVPDPVDFRDFQRINLYKPGANMYRDENGDRRPLARRGADDVMLWYEDFVRQETVMGPGGQIHAFEAVFSPRGADGKPVPIFNRDTGDVDTDAVKAWEKYDIRLQLERRWPELGPRLAGKLYVFAGEYDSFYLEGAVRLLKESLAKLGSDAVVEIAPGMPHTIHTPGMDAMWDKIRSDEALWRERN